MKNTSGGTTRNFRRGTAQLQLLVFLPLFAAMLVGLMAVGDLARLRTRAMVRARNAAWSARRGERKRLKVPSANVVKKFGRILGKKQSPLGGLAIGEVTIKSQKATAFGGGSTSARHVVLLDSWDYRTIRFEGGQSKRQLTIDPRARVFADGTSLLSLNGLLAGASVSDALLGTIIENASVLNNQLNPNRLKNSIKQLSDTLTLLEQQHPLPLDKIQLTQKRLTAARRQLTYVDRGLNKIEERVPGVRRYSRLPPVDWFDSDLRDEDELADEFDEELP